METAYRLKERVNNSTLMQDAVMTHLKINLKAMDDIHTRYDVKEKVRGNKVLTFFHSAAHLSCSSPHNTFCPVPQRGS